MVRNVKLTKVIVLEMLNKQTIFVDIQLVFEEWFMTPNGGFFGVLVEDFLLPLQGMGFPVSTQFIIIS